MVSLHADHIIKETKIFQEDIKKSVSVAKENKLVLIGIPPVKPETGYGYIECGDSLPYKKLRLYTKCFMETKS